MIIIDESNRDIHAGGFIGSFYIRQMGPFKENEIVQGHDHKIDHVTNFVRGKARIEWENKNTGETGIVELHVPCKILIKREVWHKFTPLEDDTYWECWFSEAEAEKVYGDSDKVSWTT